jgi:hypothetical protein
MKLFYVFFILLFFNACYPLLKKQQQPIAHFCYLNLQDYTVTYSGKEPGMVRIEMYKVEKKEEFNSSYVSTFLNESYAQPVTTIHLQEKDTLYFKANRLVLKIWDKLPTLESYYWIEVSPEMWGQKKLIYCRVNTQ